MKQRLPDFFLITNENSRREAEEEYMSDHKLSRKAFESLYDDHIQLSGETFTRRLLSTIAEKNLQSTGNSKKNDLMGSNFNESLLLNILAEKLNSDKNHFKKLLQKIKAERETEKELNKARK
jgi:hypothetical protein